MTSTVAPRPFPGDLPLSTDLWRQHKLSGDEQAAVLHALGRAPTYTELGVFSVMWSEHCSYKSSRAHLSRLPTTGPRVLQGPGENAGVVDVGNGVAAVFKIESHNHPSFLEPYQGAATGVGGILRDIFTMGARPIASLNSLRFGRPDHPRTPELLRGVVAGIGGYGNCIGVPTVGGEIAFDARYDGNILVNAFACGVARHDGLFYGRAEGVGNPVLYVGAPTGRDGIHGATMASDEFQEEGPSQRPTVQVGDPFMEKLLLEACLEIFAEDVLAGVQDMGAAGLTSSSVEMASRSGSGLDLDLDLVPRRAMRLTPYEILLSESQERMLLVAKKGCEDRVIAICQKWDLDVAVIGTVTDTGRWVVRATPGYDPLAAHPAPRAPQVVCDLPVGCLTDDAPRYDRPQAPDPSLPARHAFDCASVVPTDVPFSEQLLGLLASPNLGSRRWVWRQFDSIVRGGTRVRPGSDAAVVRTTVDGPEGERVTWLAFACDGNGRFVDLDPVQGAAMAVAEACRNVVVTGAEPVGLTNCLNFGSPENPVVMGQLAGAIDGIAAACRALSVPVVSGNVSLYNETNGRPILPTPVLTAVGRVEHPDDIVSMTFSAEGDAVILFGPAEAGDLGGSEYLASLAHDTTGKPPPFDLNAEAKLQRLCLGLARQRLVRSMHDVADGGLAVALSECCVAQDLPDFLQGATLTLPVSGDVVHAAGCLFGETPSRVVASVAPAHLTTVLAQAAEHGVPATSLGQVGGDRLTLTTKTGTVLVDVSLRSLRHARENCLVGVGDDAAALPG